MGRLRLVVDNPTQDLKDGALVDLPYTAIPITAIIDTAEATHKLVKIALRCDTNYQTTGDVKITFTGDTASRWLVADGAFYQTPEVAEFATYATSLTLHNTVYDRNYVLWLKANTDDTEQSLIDTSVSLIVQDVGASTTDTYTTRRVVVIPEPEPEPYIDHTDRMRQHLISEFQWDVIDSVIQGDKPILRAILTALGEQIDEVNHALYELKTKRWLDTAEGVQLDGIGQIVDRSRRLDIPITVPAGDIKSYVLEDKEYRLVLYQKVIKNSSPATAEDTIKSLKFVLSAPMIVLEELGNADVSVAVARQLTEVEKELAEAVNLIIKAGGVGLRYKAFYPYIYFGFFGQLNAKGFSIGIFAHIF